MAEIWNLWEVRAPPICTFKMVLNHKVVFEVSNILFDILKTLRQIGHEYIDKEGACLSRFLYKYKRIFRHDRGMQFLVKIHQCLKRYLKLNLIDVINSYKQTLPSRPEAGATHAYLPPRQMLKWILLRIQAFSQIFARLIELTKETGRYIYGKMLLGWSLPLNFLVFSITSRLLVLSKFLVNKSIEWYNSLYEYLPHFEMTADYLADYTFPVNLRKWLGDVDLMPPNQKSSIDEIFQTIDLLDLDDMDEDDDIKIEKCFINSSFKSEIGETSSEVQIVKEVPQNNRGTKRSRAVEDIGVPVEDNQPNGKKFRKRSRKRKWQYQERWHHQGKKQRQYQNQGNF